MTPKVIECLAATESRMTPAPWSLDTGPNDTFERVLDANETPVLDPGRRPFRDVEENWAGLLELRNAAPGMLAYIAALEAALLDSRRVFNLHAPRRFHYPDCELKEVGIKAPRM